MVPNNARAAQITSQCGETSVFQQLAQFPTAPIAKPSTGPKCAGIVVAAWPSPTTPALLPPAALPTSLSVQLPSAPSSPSRVAVAPSTPAPPASTVSRSPTDRAVALPAPVSWPAPAPLPATIGFTTPAPMPVLTAQQHTELTAFSAP